MSSCYKHEVDISTKAQLWNRYVLYKRNSSNGCLVVSTALTQMRPIALFHFESVFKGKH